MDQTLSPSLTNVNCGLEEFPPNDSPISADVEVRNNETMIEQFERKLVVGRIVKGHEDAYLLYCEYGRIKGFSVRKGKQDYFHGSKELNMKEFNCSCCGKKDGKCSTEGKQASYLKMETRTGCMARLRIGRKTNEEWRVIIFQSEHNHDMAATDESYMLRSAHTISYAKGDTLKALVDAGFSVANAYSYMQQESFGRENVGFLKKDAYDYLNRLAKSHRQVEDGDAAELLSFFKKKSNEDALFYWDFQVDENNRMCNFFFRDGRSRIDYEAFGDVLSFDTTYKTNKYNMICGPFTGINHHKSNLMFGLAFMSDETEASFEWLFDTFLKSMGGKQPETIFTDQCQAMMNAIETSFPNSQHRLCQWHINQNAPSHFGSLNNDSKFKNLFYKCMEFCESEEEFESIWREMIVEYNLFYHSWLNKMYKLRYKWSTAFSRNHFSAGLKASSRSEGTNSTLKLGGKRTHTLFECVLRFERVQDSWRQDEKEDDYQCRRGKPTLAVENNCLLRDAASVYTHKIYNMFQTELISSLGIDFDGEPSQVGALLEFEVKSQGSSKRIRKVKFDMGSHEVECSCQHYESVGILCKHALLVLKQMNVHKIPTKYLKKRWTKRVRERSYSEEERFCSVDRDSATVYVNYMMTFCYDLIMRSKAHQETRNMVNNGLKVVLSDLNGLLDHLSLDTLGTCGADVEVGGSNPEKMEGMKENLLIETTTVLNPLYVKSRGLNNVRLPSHWDSKSKRKKRNIGSSKRTTRSLKGNVQSSGLERIACPLQDFTNAQISIGATSAQFIQGVAARNFQDINNGSQSSTNQSPNIYHMPFLPLNVGNQPFNFRELSTHTSQYWDPSHPTGCDGAL